MPAKAGRLGDRKEYADTVKAVLLAIFGLRATVDTKVGNDYVSLEIGGACRLPCFSAYMPPL